MLQHLSLSVVSVVTTMLIALMLLLAAASDASPLEALLTEYLESDDGDTIRAGQPDADYDLHYDQRQTGSENYRLSLDGVMLAVPAASETTLGSLGSLATNYLMEMAAAAGETDDDDDTYGGGYGEEEEAVDEADNVVEEEEAAELQVDDSPTIVAAADQHEHHSGVPQLGSKRRTNSMGLSRGAAAGATVSQVTESAKKRPANRVKMPKADGATFVQQSRTHPSSGPAKKRNK